MVNSIRDKLDEADTISEIRLTLTHNPNNVCVVVEGEDDQRLFRPLLADNVEVFQSYASNTGVDNIVQNYFSGNNRVIGIRDKDYLTSPVNNQCFFCDYCCAEMMIISVDSCFDRLYCSFYRAGRMNSEEVRLHCLERLEKLSKLRKLSYTSGWSIRFDGIKPSKHYKINISAMEAEIINELNIINPTNQIDTARESICDALPKCTSLPEYLMITNGHDFVNLFCKVATNTYGQTSIKSIEATLRGTFSIDDFKRTALYNELNTYQSANNIQIVS